MEAHTRKVEKQAELRVEKLSEVKDADEDADDNE